MTPTIYIVTPSFNAAETIDRTIHSVVSQAGDFRIRYHVQDGGSTDGTVERLTWWAKHLRSDEFLPHAQSIRFSFASEPDAGMYDALVKGFASLNGSNDAFMTWINADDILMPGAVALAGAMQRQFKDAQLSWFGGALCILRDDMITLSFDRPIARGALRAGLCDGRHWDYLQQKGTFFRKWLWTAVDPARTIAPMKLAGDWNLWRLMAQKASFAQISVPLGGFRVSEGQLSASQRDCYLGEIDSLLPQAARKTAFEALCAAAPLTRRRIKATQGSTFSIFEETIDLFAQHRYQTVFGAPAPWSKRAQPAEKLVAKGKPVTYAPVTPRNASSDLANAIQRRPGIIALDLDWQFPAITEQHAFTRITSAIKGATQNTVYIAYPWATLIDKVQNKAPDADLHLQRFEQFCELLPQGVRKVTVCQHIHGHRYAQFFHQAGIKDVFWTHATHDDVARATMPGDDLRFHPFPLYPVQVTEALPEAAPEADGTPRKYLFSFIGARANQYYLTEARNWILDLLKDDPRGLIIGRDSWHYQKVVYDLQIKGSAAQTDAPGLADSSAADQFKNSLLQSTFALCPGGSGPNSIRLWESIGAGSIPVILADTWAPPGDRRLWDMAAVFCKESPDAIKALPDQLAAIAAEPGRLAQMRHAMRQLWLLYGPDAFVTDVQEFLLGQPVAGAATPGDAADPSRSSDPVDALSARHFLLQYASRLLLDPEAAKAESTALPGHAQHLARARDLAGDARLNAHVDALLARARITPCPSAPAVLGRAVPKLCLFGRHAKRTPLSYAPIRQIIGARLTQVDAPEDADLVVTGFNIDLRENAERLLPLAQRKDGPRFVVLSEEPLWDITWSGEFTGRNARINVPGGEIAYSFLGHETSDIYNFERVPYFVLTENHYAARYANMMAVQARRSAKELLNHWQTTPIRAAFFAEKRLGDAYARAFPERDVAGLSMYRTQLAEIMQGKGALCMGKGWGAEVRRQDLPDWHLDKLAHLAGRCFIAGAYENVHQNAYISEKIFDAFAVGAVPAYWAGPNHRVFDLVPEAAMINTYGLDLTTSAEQLSGFTPDIAFAERWLATCAQLQALFTNVALIAAERQRVANHVQAEIAALVA